MTTCALVDTMAGQQEAPAAAAPAPAAMSAMDDLLGGLSAPAPAAAPLTSGKDITNELRGCVEWTVPK